MIIFEKIKAYITPIMALISALIGYRMSENKREAERLKERLDEKDYIIESIKESAEIDRHVNELSESELDDWLHKHQRD